MFDILRKMNTVAFTSAWKLPYVLPHSPVGGNLTCGSSSSSTSWAGSYTSTSFRNLSLLYASQNSRKKQQQTRRIRCGVVQEIDEGKFSDVVLKSDRPVLVEFVATWCGPCRLIAPAVESLAQEYEEKLAVVKIDHDSNPRLIEEYKVYGLPTLILFKDGKEVPDSRREGAITKVKLKEYVDALLQSVSVA